MDRSELEQLSSQELHDRTIDLATERLDVPFLWSLVKAIPAAEAAAGHVDEAQADIASLRALLGDVRTAGEGDLAEALRPMYIDYLDKHT